jgi:hypothetical protein
MLRRACDTSFNAVSGEELLALVQNMNVLMK